MICQQGFRTDQLFKPVFPVLAMVRKNTSFQQSGVQVNLLLLLGIVLEVRVCQVCELMLQSLWHLDRRSELGYCPVGAAA